MGRPFRRNGRLIVPDVVTAPLSQTRYHPMALIHRSISAALCCCLFLAGCVTSSVPPAPSDVGTTAARPVPARKEAGPAGLEVLRTIQAARLSPDQAVD